MPTIRIISAPKGEAPLNIREAWIGLELPVIPGKRGARGRYRSQGVLSGPRTFLGAILHSILGRYTINEGYAVDGSAALVALSATKPEAALWWREHAPRSVAFGNKLVFDAEACELLPE